MTNMNDTSTTLSKGDIRFYDKYVPPLEAGDYIIKVTQNVNPDNPSINDNFSSYQAFSVQGPRYSLPAGNIFSVFPPECSQGVFEQFLPHVVLTKRELPWEKNVFGDGETPWLALLLFVDGEQIKGKDALQKPNVENWVPNLTKTANIPASNFYNQSTGEDILWPSIEPEWYETDDILKNTQCTIIDISWDAFNTFIPKKSDLQYLAHVREVNPSDKDTGIISNSDGFYSVVIGKRLPDAPPASSSQPGKLNIVHLVSLEGFQNYINDNDNNNQKPDGINTVRMISFKSWTFTCLPESGESFSELANGLLKDAQGNEKVNTFNLPLNPASPASDESQYAYQVVQDGYVPLRYQTCLGEQTFAWYRGPFSPVPVNNFISTTQQSADDPDGWRPFNTASSAIIYDNTYGIFNVSYGVAWETGRLLALSNGNFGQALFDWQQKGHKLIDLIMERKSQITELAGFDPANPDQVAEKDLLELIKPYAITNDFMEYLVTQFSGQIAPKSSAQTQAPDDGPFPAYPDMPTPPVNPQTITDLLQETDVQEAVRMLGGQELDNITDWLAQLYLLQGVPFENLVPHADLLPVESVRFFYLDSNWLDCLVEGALSIGIESSRDILYQDLMKDMIWNTTFSAVQQVRDNLMVGSTQQKPEGGDTSFDQGAMAGMLLRSALVSGWPGLRVNAYTNTLTGSSDPDTSTFIKLLRMERLSNDVMLCLWPAVPAVITIGEPQEGIAFGFDDSYCLNLRSLDPSSYGQETEKYVINAYEGIIDASRFVNIKGSGGLTDRMQDTLPGSPSISVHDFAVQMIKVPEQAVFSSQKSNEKEISHE